MKNRKIIYLLVSVAIVIVAIAGFLYVFHVHRNNPQGDAGPTFVKALEGADGNTLGNIYVSYIGNTNVFTALYVSTSTGGENNFIYKIDDTGFSNTLGKELDIASSGFYGFQMDGVGSDYFSLHALYNTSSGRAISDDIVIRWNPDQQVFEIDPNSTAQMGSIKIGTLAASDGSILGSVYVDYTYKNIFATLHIMQEINSKQVEVYEINALGFYNTALGTKDISISPNDFYGYQLTEMGSDYFDLQLLNKNQSVSEDFKVQWNYDKKTFQVQSSTP